MTMTETHHYRTTNPSTGEVLEEFDALDDAAAEELLARAHAAFKVWSVTPIAERVAAFRRLNDLIQKNAEEIGNLISVEMGKPPAQAIPEVQAAGAMFGYYADHGPDLLKETPVEVSYFQRTYTRKEAIGVVLGIEPWNAPAYQAMRATAPNLMLGNTVIVKPAEITARSTLRFDALFDEAGFPEGSYQTGLITREQVSTFIADPRVRAVTLTGSDRAGSIVGQQATAAIKPVVLELGGSDAFIVLDDADVDKAVGIISTCRLLIGGQACGSPKRLIVTEAVADEFIEKFVAAFESQVVGDPFDPNTTIGPVSSLSAAELLQAQLDDAIDKGVTVNLAGGRVDETAFFNPVVISDITPEMRAFSEEVFGPIAMVYRVKDADEAVELANSSKYGLTGGVFSEDVDKAVAVAERLDTGGVGINTFIGAPLETPFGGTKASGVGRELGTTGMDAFANLKSYAIG